MARTRAAAMVLGALGLMLGVGGARADQPARLLADTMSGTSSGMTSVSRYVGLDGYAYFRAGSPATLWKSDGHAAHTVAIAGTGGLLSDPVAMPGTSKLMLAIGTTSKRALMGYDAATGVLENFGALPSSTSVPAMAFANGRVLFLGVNTNGATGLWSSDGTVAGTYPVVDPTQGTVSNLTAAGSRVFFFLRTPTGANELWSTNGSAQGTARAAILGSAPGWGTAALRPVGERVLFSQTPTGSTLAQVWVSDGTYANTRMVSTMPTGATTIQQWAPDGTGAYGSRTAGVGTEFWRFSPVTSECQSLLSFARSTFFTQFGSFGSMTIFGDGGSSYGTVANLETLWITDGSVQNTLAIPGFPGSVVTATGNQGTLPADGRAGGDAAISGSQLFLAANVNGMGQEPWRLDLVSGSIEPMGDLVRGAGGSMAKAFFPLDGGRGAGFLAYDTGTHFALYTSDGTAPGTRLASRLAGLTTQFSMVSIGSRVFMTGYGTYGYEPYAVDLCPADYDNSGYLDVNDVMRYLNDWFAGDAAARLDGAGGSPSMQDLMGYINSWFSGC